MTLRCHQTIGQVVAISHIATVGAQLSADGEREVVFSFSPLLSRHIYVRIIYIYIYMGIVSLRAFCSV